MITEAQRKLLFFIDGYIKEHKIAPSYAEMAKAIGIKAKSNINALMEALSERGMIRYAKYKARSVEVLRLPGVAPLEDRLAAALKDNDRLRGVLDAIYLKLEPGRHEITNVPQARKDIGDLIICALKIPAP